MTEKPHEVLQRAANALEERAGKATKNICHDWLERAVRHVARNCEIDCGHQVDGFVDEHGVDHSGWDRYEDSPWIIATSPAVAAPLVALLRATSQYARALEVLRGPVAEDMHVEHALAFARMVLGEAT